MGIFNSIKKSRRASSDIDEKIEYLNKELEKTGLREAMTTSGMYFATGQEPNASHNAFKALSHDGQSLGFSGTDYNIFTEPIGGLKYSPPHPVTGQRQVAQSYFGIASDFRPVSANSDRQIIWVFDQDLSGGAGRYFSMELTRGLSPNYFGVWIDTAFGTSILVPYEGDLSPLSDRIKNNLNNLNINNFNDPNSFGPENNTIAFKNDLGDPDFLPIDTAKKFIAGLLGLAGEGFDFLKEKAKEAVDNIKDTFGYRAEIAISVANDKEFVRTNEEVTDREKEDLKNGLDPDKVPINNKETGYSDQRFYEDEKGNIVKKPKNPLDDINITEPNWKEKITPEVRKKYDEWKKVESEHPDNTGFVSKVQNEKPEGEKVTAAEVGGLAARGQAHHEFVNPTGNTKDAYYHYKDYAYAASDSKDPDEFPNPTDAAAAAAASAASGGSKIKNKYGEEITGMSVVEVKIPYSEWTKEMKDSFNKRTKTKPSSTNESYITEGVGLGHFDPEELNVDINDIRKGIMPEFPENPPPEMIDGYSAKSKLAPKVLKGQPFIKVTKKDLAALHILKDSEIKELLQQIDLINAYLQNNPADLVYAQQRYPKDDIRLAKLNWKMDQMMQAGKEYMDKHYPENQKLFTKIQKSIKKNIKLTDPKSFKGVKIPKFKGVDLTDFKRRKEVVARHYKKVVKTKKLFSRKKT